MNCIAALKTSNDDFHVEYEILTPIDLSAITDPERRDVVLALQDVETQINLCEEEVAKLNTEIDKLTNHADGLDYAVAVASGIIAGIIDSMWVGEFSIDRANEWGNDKIENYVITIAQKQGYKGSDLPGAIKYLEKQFPIAADKATNDFGGGLQHHLRDFSHHPTPVGLLFSLLTQFTGNVYGTDVAGVFKSAPVDAEVLIGKNFPEKMTLGVIHWFFHMVSDIAGSSTSAKNGSLGTGLPGPLVSFLKEISALPIFRNMNEKGYKEFSVWISKLFNGTLLGKRDENGKLIEAVKFDFRTELGIAHELGRQTVPVIVNECIVRGFYFARRLYTEIKNNDIRSVSDLGRINWKNTLPIKNRTVERMITISTGTFTAFDIAEAAIRSGGFNTACLLRINFVGIGRFAVAIVTDAAMGVKKTRLTNERINIMGQELTLLNAKVFYKCAQVHYAEADMLEAEADMWLTAQDTEQVLSEVYAVAEESLVYVRESLTTIREDMERISSYQAEIDKHNPGLIRDISNIMKWGKK